MKPRNSGRVKGAEFSFVSNSTAEPPFASLPDEAAVQAALERKPEVQVEAAFAHRVAKLAAAQPTPRARLASGYARTTALVMTVLVAAALFVLAPRAAASFTNLTFDLELVVLVQLSLVAWWLARRSRDSR